MKTWWERASTEDRLAQIDGGIECGMTAKQISLCVGASAGHDGGTLRAFATRYGRNFPSTYEKRKRAGQVSGRLGGQTGGIMSARLRGRADYEISSAFEIFGPREASQNLFEEA